MARYATIIPVISLPKAAKAAKAVKVAPKAAKVAPKAVKVAPKAVKVAPKAAAVKTVKEQAIGLLRKGVSLDALMDLMSPTRQRHTVRGFISLLNTRLRNDGGQEQVSMTRKNGQTFYKLERA